MPAALRKSKSETPKLVRKQPAPKLLPKPKLEVVPSNNQHAASREDWYVRILRAAAPRFIAAGFPLPDTIRIGCGFTSGGKRSNHLGEAWHNQHSGDGAYEIFISPKVNTAAAAGSFIQPGTPMFQDGDLTVAGVVLHELVHAALWHAGHEKHGHGADFKALALDIGMEVINRKGGTKLTTKGVEWVSSLLEEIGPYPMAALSVAITAPKTQPTRQLLLLDPENPEFKVRMAREPIQTFGLPRSPTGQRMVIDPLSAMRTEFNAEELVALGYAIQPNPMSKQLELTERGALRASDIILELTSGGSD